MSDKEKDVEEEGEVATLTKPKVKKPHMYMVIMMNDDYTTMDFVIHVLQKFFRKTYDEANRIMLNVHHKGRDVCGIFPYDVAATKVMQVNDYARKSEMPLKCIMEKN
jgi:ATP-dependent Clp protease adaptor protein ClpS